MKQRLLIVTDLGTFKAFRVDDDGFSTNPRLEPVDAFETVAINQKLSEQLSDQAGQFRKSAVIFASINDQGNGERHGIVQENRRRSAKDIADAIAALLKDDEFESCYFAAPKEINNQLMSFLPPEAKAKIEKNLGLDLVNVDKAQLLKHFQS
ncbi:MAG: host attachment protein [Verrucomicrobiales bacterium]